MDTLIIGNKNYSSWSLRAWLFLKEFGIDFIEERIALHTEGFKREILKHSPSGLVPALCTNDLVIWDSLAICEYIADLHPHLQCWPEDLKSRAMARSVSYEMHSGFTQIRALLPMNCRKKIVKEEIPAELQAEIARVCDIWRTCRQRSTADGPFLFGRFSIADAMYAPVVVRFNGYGIKVGELEQHYMQTILSLANLKAWFSDAGCEDEVLDLYEVGP
jgi:glutathione S-transferase